MRRLMAMLVLAASVGCSSPEPVAKPVSIATIDSKLVPNLRRVSPHIYSSARPENEEAFRELASLGIRTIICVDGEKPDVEAARRAGIRYVHLPLGYGTIPRQQALRIGKAVRDLPGPVLIHCQHGTQRGPAAAAIGRLVCDGGTNDEALEEMRGAGLQPRYKALAASVASFQAPTAAELAAVPAAYPEIAAPASLRDTMVEIDHRFDRIEQGKPHEGDLAHEALLLHESFVELARASASAPDWKARLAAAVGTTGELEAEANKGPPSKATLEGVKQSCTACHERYRDQ